MFGLVGKSGGVARRLATLIIVFSSAITLVTSAVQLAIEYRDLRNGIDRELDNVNVYRANIANSVWNFDDRQIQSALDGLAKLPFIARALAQSSDTGKTWSAGGLDPSSQVTRQYALVHATRPGALAAVGQLTVVASLDAVYSQIVGRAVTIVVSNGIKTFCVALFTLYLFRQLVTRRLEALAARVQAMAPNQRPGVLTAGETPPADCDELQIVDWHVSNTARRLALAASETELAQANLRSSEQRLRQVVETNPNGILMVDAEGQIMLANRAVADLFGYSREELAGQPAELLLPVRLRGAKSPLGALQRPAEAAPTAGPGQELEGRRKDGAEFAIRMDLAQVETGDGSCTLISIIDMEHRKRIEVELQRSNADLAQFAYVASHDLQEPLRMVSNYTQLLAERYRGRLDEKADKYIHYAVDGAKRMSQLVADLLAYSKVNSQAKPMLPVSAGEVLARVGQTLRARFEAVGGCLEVASLPVVMADELQLGQLFQNLIGNAIKFRSDQPLKIQIAAEKVPGRWRFSVRDNGIGIEPQYNQRIFDMFQRLHERGSYEGSGIGLSIVKRIVERHGGQVWLESEAGKGSCFFFTLLPVGEEGDSPPSEITGEARAADVDGV